MIVKRWQKLRFCRQLKSQSIFTIQHVNFDHLTNKWIEERREEWRNFAFSNFGNAIWLAALMIRKYIVLFHRRFDRVSRRNGEKWKLAEIVVQRDTGALASDTQVTQSKQRGREVWTDKRKKWKQTIFQRVKVIQRFALRTAASTQQRRRLSPRPKRPRAAITLRAWATVLLGGSLS